MHYADQIGAWIVTRHDDVKRILYDHDHPLPKDAPGFRRLRTGEVSAVIATVRERAPEYCRDEGGDNSGCLIGEDG
ncbi:hypothetical protein ACFWJ5_37240 [Streptomyces qaidamensis]|uniref:hypothetical protein n=1 Tax=Streptomyces qaidamensis TaxID=1783515 RepID=UPI00364D5EF3